MTERPILFNAQMVRALQECRKTQTRRIVKPRHGGVIVAPGGPGIALEDLRDGNIQTNLCPYGRKPGDRLYVRETFDPIYGQSPPDRVIEIDYKADWVPHGNRWRMKDVLGGRRWTPSIHMPRWASRFTMEITADVMVEKLQDISEEDALAEGVLLSASANPGKSERMAREAFKDLWMATYPGLWESNPWVWRIEFKNVEQWQ